MTDKKIFLIIKLLSAFGVVLASYLLWQQFTQSQTTLCNINQSINCDAIISGVVSKTFGIPTPLYGFIGYIVLFIAALVKFRKTILGVATFGLGFCLWIGYIEIFQLQVICPVCIACQLVMLSIFILALRININKQ